MLSLICFSLLIFIMISNTVQQNDLIANSCFNFEYINYNQTQFCTENWFRFRVGNTIDLNLQCIRCTITHVDIRIKYNCLKNFECATLVFDNNMIFEEFFMKYRDRIQSLFPASLQISPNPVLRIILSKYNITRITNEYINSTVNMNFPMLMIFIRFIQRLQSLVSLTVDKHFSPIRFHQLILIVQCDNENSSITYRIYKNNHNNEPNKTGECTEFQPTKQVSCS